MRIDCEYLKEFVTTKLTERELSEVLFTVGIENSIISSPTGPVLDIEITPNRPDWLSHYGICREIAARFRDLTFRPRILPEIVRPLKPEPFSITIEDPADCPRYSGCIVRRIKVKESSAALKRRMERVGLRSISNIVDISNLVMYTCGHPIHIFDLKILTGRQVVIRRGKKGEDLILLDEKKIELNADHLVIADAEKPVALAGVMGGLHSGVSDSTCDVFIESAYFHPHLIRRTSRQLGLKTDASYRFERGMNPEGTMEAMGLALALIEAETGQAPQVTYLDDVYPLPHAPQTIFLDKSYPSTLTGVVLPEHLSREILTKLGFTLTDQDNRWQVTVPPFRVDLSGREDLVEEIIRIYGYDHLVAQLPSGCSRKMITNPEREAEIEVGHHLTGNGFFEMVNYVFQAPEDNLSFPEYAGVIELKNPLGRDFSQLKNSLLPGIMRNMVFNVNQGFSRLAVFEFGNRFYCADGEIHEEKLLAMAVSGLFQKKDWRTDEQPFDFSTFLTLVQSLFRKMRWPLRLIPDQHPFYEEECCFRLSTQSGDLGLIGQIKQDKVIQSGLDSPVFAAEWLFNRLRQTGRPRGYISWSRFPATKRDFSFLIDRTKSFRDLVQVIEDVKPAELSGYDLIDRYQGEKIAADQVGFLISFSYRSGEKTLTAEEANSLHRELVWTLVDRLKLVQR